MTKGNLLMSIYIGFESLTTEVLIKLGGFYVLRGQIFEKFDSSPILEGTLPSPSWSFMVNS